MRRSNRGKSGGQQTIATERIAELFKQAETAEQNLANRYVQLARKISLKYKVPFSKAQKQRYCKKCESFLIPGQNVRIRTNKGKKTVKCLNCNNIMRFLYK